jgi:hypothetical protein
LKRLLQRLPCKNEGKGGLTAGKMRLAEGWTKGPLSGLFSQSLRTYRTEIMRKDESEKERQLGFWLSAQIAFACMGRCAGYNVSQRDFILPNDELAGFLVCLFLQESKR